MSGLILLTCQLFYTVFLDEFWLSERWLTVHNGKLYQSLQTVCLSSSQTTKQWFTFVSQHLLCNDKDAKNMWKYTKCMTEKDVQKHMPKPVGLSSSQTTKQWFTLVSQHLLCKDKDAKNIRNIDKKRMYKSICQRLKHWIIRISATLHINRTLLFRF